MSSYGQYSQNPYQQDAPVAQTYPPSVPYSQENYEMQNYQPAPTTMSQQDFLTRAQELRDEIRALTGDIDYIGQLHQRTLGSTDGQANQQLEQFVSQTQVRNTAIKDGIKGLEKDLAKTTDASRNIKSTQFQSIKTQFEKELAKFRNVESDYSKKYREQIGRQFRIVNPDASETEVQEAMNADWGNEGVFQTALRTNRTGHASSVLGNVRARHNELQRIEQTLSELTAMFEELATVVEVQDTAVQQTEGNAIKTTGHLEDGIAQQTVAVEHAARARRLKWWCLLVVVLIILAVALGVGLGVGLAQNATS